MPNYDKYVGIPYVDDAAACDFSGVNCWGLCRLFYRNEYNIELPDYHLNGSDSDIIIESCINEQTAGAYEKTSSPRSGDIVLMSLQSDYINHVGIFIAETNSMLHAYSGTGAVITRLDSLYFRRNVKGFARLKGF